MNDQQILEKAIQKAIDGGYKPEPLFAWIPEDKEALLEFWLNKDHPHYPTVIFNHDFAKALWGNAYIHTCGRHYNLKDCEDHLLPAWKYRLQQMVVADDAIAYLGEHLNA